MLGTVIKITFLFYFLHNEGIVFKTSLRDILLIQQIYTSQYIISVNVNSIFGVKCGLLKICFVVFEIGFEY